MGNFGDRQTASGNSAGSSALDERPAGHSRTSVGRVLIESAAVVLSILLALALDQWAEDRDKLELANKSLASFELEIQHNLASLEDVAPYHRGIRDVLIKMDSAGEIRTVAQLRAVVASEEIRPPVLQDVAWQTAVATGSLTYMGFETVSALSLTYTFQHRFQDQARISQPDLNRASTTSPEDLQDLVRSIVLYLRETMEGEEQLMAIHRQAIEVIRQANPSAMTTSADAERGAKARDRAHL